MVKLQGEGCKLSKAQALFNTRFALAITSSGSSFFQGFTSNDKTYGSCSLKKPSCLSARRYSRSSAVSFELFGKPKRWCIAISLRLRVFANGVAHVKMRDVRTQCTQNEFGTFITHRNMR